MRKFTTKNKITLNSVERFLPVKLITDGILNKSGIFNGGISTLEGQTMIERASSRQFHNVIFSISGEGCFEMEDGSVFNLSPGEFFFSSPSGQGHKHYPSTNKWTLCWFHIHEDTPWLTDFPKDYEVSVSTCHNEICNCLKSIIDEETINLDDSSLIQESLCRLLIFYLKRETKASSYSGKNLLYIRRFNDMWKEVAYSVSEKWSYDIICEYMHMSRAHTIRLCKKIYGVTPTDKVRQIKMEQANLMLRYLGNTVSEVAEAVGYESLSSFTTAFKKLYNITPSQLLSSKM